MLLLILTGMIGWHTDGSMQQVEFLRVSHKANKDSFASGAFRFHYTRGSSASLSDAESEVLGKAFEESGYYVFDGDNARYDLLAEPAVLASATRRIDNRRSSASITAFRALTDGKFTLRDNIQLAGTNAALRHGAIIFPGVATFYKSGSFEFPLELGDKGGGAYDLFQDLTWVKDGRIPLWELDMDSRLGELKVCKFSYTWKDGMRTYWIDVDRGAVPVRIHDHYNPNNADVTYIFSDLEHVAGAGWLPRRRLHVVGPGAIVDRIVITDIDVVNKPPRSTFQLDFPEPTTLFDEAKKLTYPKRKSWSLLNLPSPTGSGVRPTMPFTRPPELPDEAEPVSLRTKILFALVVLFLGIGSFIVLARRIRGPRGA
jgi:hypothetical protein